MTHPAKIILYAAILLVLCGCRQRSDSMKLLDKAEGIMETAPDSALALLDGMDMAARGTEAEKARYALLRSMALDKNYIDVTDDSLISIAHDYYDGRNDTYHRMLSKYYYARVLYYAGEYDTAIVYALDALGLNEATDYLWEARINELISFIYHHSFLYNLEIETTKRAIASYRKSGRDRNVAYARASLAIALYANSEDFTASAMEDTVRARAIADNYPALALMDSVREEAIALNDSLLLSYTLSGLVKINNSLRRFSDALDCYRQMAECSDFRSPSVQDHFDAGIAALNLGEIPLAEDLLSEARKGERCDDDVYNNILLEKEICQATGRLDKAVALADTLITFQNRSNLKILNQPVMVAQQRYHYAKRNESEKATHAWKTRLVAAVALLIIAALAVFAVVKLRMDRLRKTLDYTMGDVSELLDELKAKEKRISEDRSRLEELCSLSDELRENKDTMSRILSERQQVECRMAALLQRQFSTIDAVCSQYYTEDGSVVNHKLLYEEISAELDKIRDDKSLDRIVDIVNLCKDQIIDRINSQYPQLTAADRHFLGLIYSGLSIKSIAVILRKKTKSVYTRKSRLFAKISSHTTIDPKSGLET